MNLNIRITIFLICVATILTVRKMLLENLNNKIKFKTDEFIVVKAYKIIKKRINDGKKKDNETM